MKVDQILIESKEILVDLLSNVEGGNSVFPEGCNTNDYCITEESGKLIVPTKFKIDGKRLFIEISTNLAVE